MNGELLSLKKASETLKEIIRHHIQVSIVYGTILWVQYIMRLYCMKYMYVYHNTVHVIYLEIYN